MTRLYDDPKKFSDDALEGFLTANRDYVLGVPGGVVRARETPAGKVAVVVGGGSGHYPAFCGIVGPGFADGAVVGNIFTSPSTQEAYTVGKAASSDAGLLLSAGNYAGDVMNFALAKERLDDEGIDTRLVFVTDDVASAPVDQIDKRRGIAGDFVVFKVAGAAAEDGYDLDEVERVARLANDRTRSMGVAFDGCTMPGASQPLFTVPKGKMGVGLGSHGEPGVSEDEMPRAADLARLLVDRVLAERPEDAGPRVGLILNGLGDTKYEELFVVYRTVAALIKDADLEIVDPEVGELVTSLDMAGCSLTLVFLDDDELERLWRAPADSPAYRKGEAVAAGASAGPRREPADLSSAALAGAPPVSAGSQASQRAAATALAALQAMSAAIADAEDELGRIDAVAGDGDHGRGMVKGVTAAVAAAQPVVEADGGAKSLLGAAGDAWAAKAGGTSGALWGGMLRSIGASIGNDAEQVGPADVEAAIRAGVDTLQRLGKAEPGDKTMLDAIVPFVDALKGAIEDRQSLDQAWRSAAEVASTAAERTADLRPKVGRARPLAERSIGIPDAGAVSMALCLRTVAGVLVDR